MTNLGPTAHYLGMEIIYINTSITIIQTIYINQFLTGYQMSHCNTASTFMVKRLSLLPIAKEFAPYIPTLLPTNTLLGVLNGLPIKLDLTLFKQ